MTTTNDPQAAAEYAQEYAEGVRLERERLRRILTAPEAQDRQSLAQHLAFETDTSPEEAVEILSKAAIAQPTHSRFH